MLNQKNHMQIDQWLDWLIVGVINPTAKAQMIQMRQ